MTVVDEMNLAVREFYGSLNTLNAFLRIENVMAKRCLAGRRGPREGFCRRLRKFYIFKYSNEKQYLCLSSIRQRLRGHETLSWRTQCGDIMRKCSVQEREHVPHRSHRGGDARRSVRPRRCHHDRTDGANDLYSPEKVPSCYRTTQ